MGISIGFGLGPIRFSAPLVRPHQPHRGIPGYQYPVTPGRPMGTQRALFITLGCLVLPFAVLFQIAMFAAGGFWVGFVWLLFQIGIAVLPLVLSKLGDRRERQRAEQARREAEVAARAEYEHAAMMRGEIGLGTYGAFQPKDLWS